MRQIPIGDVVSAWDVLGIEPDANAAEIVRAYRKRVKEAHPDQGGSTREFNRVRSAYEELRAGYEREEWEAEREADAERRREGSLVAYLNYEVLDDFGWSLGDDDLFEKAAAADLDEGDYGEFVVEPTEFLLEAAEDEGLVWPFACRGGACTNCAVALIEGEMPPPTSHILPPNLIDRGIRLSCITAPITNDAKVVYNVKHLPDVEELLLPATRFERAYPTD